MSQNITENTSAEEQKPQEKPRFHINPHIVILSVIAIVFIVIAYKLYKWDKGVPSDYDPDYQTSEFDIEVLDTIIPLAPDKLEGHEDDGVTTILCLGDDPFARGRDEASGLANQIAAKSGATVYNGSFEGSTISAVNASYYEAYWRDAFCLPYLVNTLCTGNFTEITTAAQYSENEDYLQTVEMLEKLDMNTVDILCIMYDGIDYVEKRTSDDPNDPYSVIAYTGALRSAITQIQETYPFIRIVMMSHTFCCSINDEGNYQNGDRADLGNGTLSHYLRKALDVTGDCGVSLIDNFYGSVNEDNYLDYMVDYIHFNEAGQELLAERFVECILPDKSE
ncbi:MAG: SGNH/GDSL hydrolase family protein [Muribaculaceae bacterium]|nr:SGNH/GDSL hydrolase family protein [Muribaculaceae bacterium]